MSKVGESIIRGLEQAIAFAEGTTDESKLVVHFPVEIDAKGTSYRMSPYRRMQVIPGGAHARTHNVSRKWILR